MIHDQETRPGDHAAVDEPIGLVGRAVQVILGIYLLPVVLIVLAVGGLGLIGLKTARLAGRASRTAIAGHHLRIEDRRPARLSS